MQIAAKRNGPLVEDVSDSIESASLLDDEQSGVELSHRKPSNVDVPPGIVGEQVRKINAVRHLDLQEIVARPRKTQMKGKSGVGYSLIAAELFFIVGDIHRMVRNQQMLHAQLNSMPNSARRKHPLSL